MLVSDHFILMSQAEFRPWLQRQKVTRPIDKLQVHHTYIPNYETRKGDTQLETMAAMRNYHMGLGWRDIGQNITTLEDGTIVVSLGRGLNDTPAGIAGANVGALCIENVGNFDVADSKAKLDTMTAAHKASIIEVYAALAEKLNLPVDTDHVVYHAWYTASGQWLGDYWAGASSKPCPGRNWWGGDGNSRAAANKRFLPDIRARLAEMRGVAPVAPITPVIPSPQPIKEEDQPMTPAEKKEFESLKETIAAQAETIDALVKRANLYADVPLPKWAHEAVAAAKAAGAITTSADKSTDSLITIQMMHNLGLFEGGK